MDTKHILIAEDEESLRHLIDLSLSAEGYQVTAAEDGQETWELFSQNANHYAMVILDIMMPALDGFEVLQMIREISDVPVVMLTALGSGEDIVQGFQMGADDYITKPFTFKELSARIAAILRRVEWMQQPATGPKHLRCGEVDLNLEHRTVQVSNQACHFTPIEYQLLQYFLQHPGQVIGKEELFREVWGYEFEGSTNLVEVGIRRLRAKIEPDPSHPRYIHTIRGRGYRLECEESL